jgi:hypothetical protein
MHTLFKTAILCLKPGTGVLILRIGNTACAISSDHSPAEQLPVSVSSKIVSALNGHKEHWLFSAHENNDLRLSLLQTWINIYTF